MKKKEVVEKIIKIPRDFKIIKNISPYELLRNSGYIEMFNNINQSDILQSLSMDKQSIHDWLIWSEDKRSESGFYLKKISSILYVVGHYPLSTIYETKEYTDLPTACANFIKLEVEDIRQSINGNFSY